MPFCKKCGTKLNDDERFCPNCGTQNQDNYVKDNVQQNNYAASSGQMQQNNNDMNSRESYAQPDINLQQNFSYQQYNSNSSMSSNNFSVYMSETFNLMLNAITKPVTATIKSATLLKDGAMYTLYGILAIIYGLLNMWSIKAAMGGLASIFKSVLPFNRFMSMGDMDLPSGVYGKVFMISIVFFVISTLAIFITVLIYGKYIKKIDCKGADILKVTLTAAIPLVFGLFLNIIFSYLHVVIGTIIMFASLIISVICLYSGVSATLKLDNDKGALLIPMTYIIMIISNILVIKIIIKILYKSIID